jgi:hypothetical protein
MYRFNNFLLRIDNIFSRKLFFVVGISFLWFCRTPNSVLNDLWINRNKISPVEVARLFVYMVTLIFGLVNRYDFFYSPPNWLSAESIKSLISLNNRSTKNKFDKTLKEMQLQGLALSGRFDFFEKEYVDKDWEKLIVKISNPDQNLCDFSKIGKVVPKILSKSYNKKKAYKALSQFKIFMSNIKMPWYVVSGTFLGVVRQRGLLDHDNDLDVGIAINQMNEFLDHIRESKVFKLKAVRLIPKGSHVRSVEVNFSGSPALVVLKHVSGVEIDVFSHFEFLGKIVHMTTLHYWENERFKLEEYDCGGELVLGPANANKYLTENYGGNWMIPITEFNSTTDTPNGYMVNNLESRVYFSKQLIVAAAKKDWGAVGQYRQFIFKV